MKKKILTIVLAMLGAAFGFAAIGSQNASANQQINSRSLRGALQTGARYNLMPDPADADGDGVEDSRDNCPSTPNPEKIAFVDYENGNSEIFVMNSDGSNRTNLTDHGSFDGDASFSPNGSKIVFTSNRDGNTEIYVMNADGSNQTRLTNSPGFDMDPSFSGDGTKIVFVSTRNGNREIYVMNANGTNQIRLTNNPTNDYYPAFSPDGSKIAFTSNRDDPGGDIYLMDAANGLITARLTNNPGNDIEASFSPDGSKIVYKASFNSGIYVMNADGSSPVRLTFDNLANGSPTFSPDGTKIAFALSPNGIYFGIYVMNADGTNITLLTGYPGTSSSPSWGGQADADNDGTGDACENTAPTISAGSVGIAQNAVATMQPIAAVADGETPANELTVSTVGALPGGISVSNLGIDANGVVSADVAASCAARLGAHTVSLQVSDGALTATANLTVNVAPSRPAVIDLQPFTVLNVPNHKLQTLDIGQIVQSAIDDCDGDLASQITIEKATSDEPAQTDGDGDTEPDIVIGTNCRSIGLRAERSGTGDGRVYTVTIKATDSSGSTTRADYKVFVPKGGAEALEGAASYAVNGGCP